MGCINRPDGIVGILELQHIPVVDIMHLDDVLRVEIAEVQHRDDGVDGPLRAVDFQGLLAVVEGHGLDKPGKAEEMVTVEVSYKNPFYLHEEE